MGADQRRQEIQILPFLSFFVKASEKQDGSYGDIGSRESCCFLIVVMKTYLFANRMGVTK